MNRSIFITSSGKEALENYFDRNVELEAYLTEKGKEELYQTAKKIGEMIDVVSVRQKKALGLGHAVLCAEKVIGREDFAVLLGDEIIHSQGKSVTKQLACVSESHGNASVVGVLEVPKEEAHRYGIAQGVFEKDGKTLRLKKMVEKPKEFVGNLATPGRYVLTSKIFEYLKKVKKGAGGEYQLTDAINMMAEEDPFYAHLFEGNRYDVGHLPGYLKATIDFALERKDTVEFTKEIIRKARSTFS